MNSAQIEKRFAQAEAAMRRAQSRLSGETLAQFCSRLRSPEFQATARRHASRMESILRRCLRLRGGK